jgi:hypothetical protein
LLNVAVGVSAAALGKIPLNKVAALASAIKVIPKTAGLQNVLGFVGGLGGDFV